MLKFICLLILLSLSLCAQTPAELLQESGLSGGVIVHLGCGDGSETVKLATDPQYCIQGLDTGDVTAARQAILAQGKYGQVSISQLHEKRLPYADNLINLLIVERQGAVPQTEIMRVLCPLGKAYIRESGKWEEFVKPWPSDMDQWTHYLRGPDNNAVSSDENIGAPRSLRWVSYPRWGRSHEEMASMSTAVSANGKLFFINDNAPLTTIRFLGSWSLIARDAFNGTKLWEKQIPNWVDHLRHFRSGPTHLSRRLIAVDNRVFVTLGLDAPVSCLDAATGKVLKNFQETEQAEEIIYDHGKLYLMVGTSERIRKGGGLYERNEPSPSEERNIVVLDADSGEILWKKSACGIDYVMPLSLTVKENNVYYHSIKGVHCVDAATGAELWIAERPAVAKRYAFSTSTLVVTDQAVLLADRIVNMSRPESEGPADGDIDYAVHGWNESGYIRKGKNELTAYSTDDGKKLWSVPCNEGYNSPVDVFVIDDIVWTGSSFSKGYSITTGEVVRELNNKGAQVGMAHHRCYRNKATSNFILTGRDGIETIDLDKGWTGNNSWIRGTCQYGILPANGLIYAPPNACACHPKVKMQGMVAVSSTLPPSAKKDLPPPESSLIKGPAFARLTQLTSADRSLPADTWPLYRCDKMRSGSTRTEVTGTQPKWEAAPGGKLTQPVVGHGRVYVASTEKHTVYALNSKNGNPIWTYTAGGRIDSAPTLYKGLIIFGAADGWVYSLDASNGELAWQFRAAPEERIISAFGQLESAWPVHGAILVQNNEITFTAGRNTYLDGGIYFYHMNPATGQVLAANPIRHLDPITEKQTGREGSRQGLNFDSEGSTSDVLSGDGSNVFLKHMRFNADGIEQPPTEPHLFCQTGFIGEETFVRSYWVFGTNVGAGWGGWASMFNNQVKAAPAGRIMSFDNETIYGYGRIQHLAAAVGHRADATHLFASVKKYQPPEPAHEAQPAPADKKTKNKNKGVRKIQKTYLWSMTDPLITRAMVLSKNNLYIAGIPDPGIKDSQNETILQFTNNEEAIKAFMGDKGACLRVISKADGTTKEEVQLEAAPVFDGMSVAEGSLFISLKNGKVVCLGK